MVETSCVVGGFDIGRPVLNGSPFKHVLIPRALDAGTETTLLDWLETDAPWRLVETDFYEQYEFDLVRTVAPGHIAELFGQEARNRLARQMAHVFGVRLLPRVDAVAHKLLPGQRIGIHNDYLVGEETHRLTVQLNRGLRDEDGGLFMLFNSFQVSNVHSVHRPVSGSAIGFAIGPNSHHAVSRVHGGERFTLVFSFHADPR